MECKYCLLRKNCYVKFDICFNYGLKYTLQFALKIYFVSFIKYSIKIGDDIVNEHDVIKLMGRFPDKIMTKEEVTKSAMVSKIWKCSRCGKIYRFNKEVRIPAPCNECGGICFEKLRNGRD